MNNATLAREIRKTVLKMIYNAHGSHIGCAMGIVEILIALYFKVLNIDPKNPLMQNRDRFILSKGHACAAYYATLAARGFFPKTKLDQFMADGSPIAAHVTYGSLPGIEATAGSLGHGLPIGLGMAIASKQNKTNNKIYVLTGDGEMDEGSVWEAIAFAGFHKMNNLIMVIDNNRFQSEGTTASILNLEPFETKLTAFGWSVSKTDGHDVEKLSRTLKKTHSSKPYAVIARTTKGKGIKFMENDYIWHGKSPSETEYSEALKQLA